MSFSLDYLFEEQYYTPRVLIVYKQKTRQKTGFHCSGGWI
ncbi:hypothetical protein MGWOODY_Mmi2534 [hydrothermal vent metagenome]|uniref:Uncharacterized protein n=1 Tax=hydrothermal vent metagenome TaxID=652676 RepID=A0A160VDE5_9ZZZZ